MYCVLYKYHLHTNRHVYFFFTSESFQLLIDINDISVCMLNVVPAFAGGDGGGGGGGSVVV